MKTLILMGEDTEQEKLVDRMFCGMFESRSWQGEESSGLAVGVWEAYPGPP